MLQINKYLATSLSTYLRPILGGLCVCVFACLPVCMFAFFFFFAFLCAYVVCAFACVCFWRARARVCV